MTSSDEMWLPVGRKSSGYSPRRTAQFFLPHFKVKMDALPGLPTYFVFTPTMTTEDYRNERETIPYNIPKILPTRSKMLWEELITD
jgi:cytochrome c oxidase subunit 2